MSATRSGYSLARRIALHTVAAAARRLDRALVARNAYSPVPEILDEAVWDRKSSLAGVRFNTGDQLAFLESSLETYLHEFTPPRETVPGGGFYVWNSYYQAVDAEVLYAMVRHLKPSRILEVGSGFSTLVSAAACVRNAREGRPAELVAVDPAPRVTLPITVDGLARVERRSAEDLPLDRYLELETDDILFVDSSHIVKLGGEVNYLVLEVLPRLRPGVVVHFHDIFLPDEYPRAFYDMAMYLSEQYLLHAFLIGNDDYEIVFAAHAVVQAHRERVSELIPSLREHPDHHPAAFWLKRRERPASR